MQLNQFKPVFWIFENVQNELIRKATRSKQKEKTSSELMLCVYLSCINYDGT